MKRVLLLVIICLSRLSSAENISGTLELTALQQFKGENPSAAQTWIEQKTSEQNYSAALQLDFLDAHGELRVQQEKLTLHSLYLDIEAASADWTVGRKPQQWAYVHNGSQLNWLKQHWLFMREQYLSTGSWQLFCAADETEEFCGTRYSGWLNQADIQLMVRGGNINQAAAALSQTIGDGGLFYVEGLYQDSKPYRKLEPLTTEIYQLIALESHFSQWNLGFSWTNRWQTTFMAETLWQSIGLQKNDWQAINQQLNTSAAGLVADSFEQPFGRQQHLLRVSQNWGDVSLENTWVYWPSALNSWLNELQISWQWGEHWQTQLAWQSTKADGVLAAIGQADEYRLGLNYKAGF